MIKMNKRFLFPLASGITFVLLICGSLTIIENKAYAQLPGLLVSCGVGQHASPTGVCCPEGMDAVHSMCMTQQQIQAREEKYGQVFSNCVSGVREVLTGNPVGGVLGCLPEKYNPLSSVSDISGLLSGKLPNVKTLSKIGTGIIKDSKKSNSRHCEKSNTNPINNKYSRTASESIDRQSTTNMSNRIQIDRWILSLKGFWY